MSDATRTAGLAGGARARLLLAEDSPTNKMLATAILREAGYEVTAVSNGRELVEAMRGGNFDLVLVDIFMPEMDGLQAASAIRSMPGSRGKLPIIAMTAYALESDKESCLKAGMNDYVSKPIQKQELLKTIDHWLAAAGQEEAEDAPRTHVESSMVLDLSVLARLEADADEGLIRDLARAFVAETAGRIERIGRAAEAKDLAALEREALALKAGAGTFGTVQLVQYAGAIEQACLSHDHARVENAARALPRVAYQACKAVADRYLS